MFIGVFVLYFIPHRKLYSTCVHNPVLLECYIQYIYIYMSDTKYRWGDVMNNVTIVHVFRSAAPCVQSMTARLLTLVTHFVTVPTRNFHQDTEESNGI